jgi:hypothetical protein
MERGEEVERGELACGVIVVVSAAEVVEFGVAAV